jgi:hypothetical protein
MKFLPPICFFLVVTITLKGQSNGSSNVQLALEHMVSTELFELGKTYQNEFGEKFTPKAFKYYISDIGFEDDSGKFYLATTDYFLVDEFEPESKRIALNIPPGKYRKLRFMIGVDSLRSVSGVQEGSLDPYHGMFWTWNSGFISAKLEGTSPVSRMPQQMFQYDIGGYRTGQSSLRFIEIMLDKAFAFDNGQNTLLTINADILKWFNGRHQLKIAEHNFVHTPGKLAVQYADNYAAMFFLKGLKRY